MSDFSRYVERHMLDPVFATEYKQIQPEYEIVHAIIAAQTEQGITREELAKRSGLRLSNISRLEKGTGNPTLSTLKALAKGMGKSLHIEFR